MGGANLWGSTSLNQACPSSSSSLRTDISENLHLSPAAMCPRQAGSGGHASEKLCRSVNEAVLPATCERSAAIPENVCARLINLSSQFDGTGRGASKPEQRCRRLSASYRRGIFAWILQSQNLVLGAQLAFQENHAGPVGFRCFLICVRCYGKLNQTRQLAG